MPPFIVDVPGMGPTEFPDEQTAKEVLNEMTLKGEFDNQGQQRRQSFLERIINSQNNQKNMSFGDMALDAVSRSTSPTRVMGDVADVIFGASEPVLPSMKAEAEKRYEERKLPATGNEKKIQDALFNSFGPLGTLVNKTGILEPDANPDSETSKRQRGVGAALSGYADIGSFGLLPYGVGVIDTISGERPNPQGGVWDNLERNIAIQKEVQDLRAKEFPAENFIGNAYGLIKGLPGKAINAITPTSESLKGLPFLKRVLARGVSGGLGNMALGQVSDPQIDAGESLKKSVIDFGIGGSLNAGLGQIGDYVSGKIDKARAPLEVKKMIDQLDDQFQHIKDPTERASAIQQYVNDALAKETSSASGLGQGVKSGIEKELNTASENIRNFYKSYTSGTSDKVSLENARKYLSDFFKNNKFMNSSGNWIDEAGNVVDTPVIRFGAGRTSEAQQKYLFDRFNDLFRNKSLTDLHDYKQVLQNSAFKGMNPVFGSGDNKGVVKGLSNAIKTDEEAAIKALYGDDVLKEFIAKKSAFSEVADSTKGIARKIGLMNDSGDFIINKNPEDLVKTISKLPPNELEQLKPILERNGLKDLLGQLTQHSNTVNALESIGKPTNYQNIGKRLADNPEFVDAFETAKGKLPEEALKQIKGDYIERVLQKAGDDPSKIAKELSKLGDKGKSILFNPEEQVIIKTLQEQASMVESPSFLMSLLKGATRGKVNLPSHLIDPAVQAMPEWMIKLIKATGNFPGKAAPFVSRGASALIEKSKSD